MSQEGEEARFFIEDLTEKVYFLLSTYNLWAEDGTYTFPDGDTWEKK